MLLTDVICGIEQGQRYRVWYYYIISSAHLSNDINCLLAVYAAWYVCSSITNVQATPVCARTVPNLDGRHERIQTGTHGAGAPSRLMACRSGRIRSVLLAVPVRFPNALNMHEIARNCAYNAKKSLEAGAPPQIPLGDLTTLPKPLPSTPSASRFVVSDDSSLMCPSQNNLWIRPWRTCSLPLSVIKELGL